MNPRAVINPEGWLRFVHTGPFVAKWKRMKLEDDDLRFLEWSILAAPKAAPVMAGTGGLRKMRFAPPSWHTGKRGALRVCYALFEAYSIVLLVQLFPKNEQANLSAWERNEIRQVIVEVEAHLRAHERGSDNEEA